MDKLIKNIYNNLNPPTFVPGKVIAVNDDGSYSVISSLGGVMNLSTSKSSHIPNVGDSVTIGFANNGDRNIAKIIGGCSYNVA